MKKFLHKNILVAGKETSAKANFMDSLIATYISENSPADLKLILIDSSRGQFDVYNGVWHLLSEALSKPEKAIDAIGWAICEAQRRVEKIEAHDSNSQSIYDYNKASNIKNTIPEIVIFIDELADLMIFDRKFFEDRIEILSSVSDAVGIYLVISTSKISSEYIITKKIRKNFFSRIAFKLLTKEESNLIIGADGAEKLLYPGSCLVKDIIGSGIRSFQANYRDKENIAKTVEDIKDKYIDYFPSEIV